MIHYSRILSHSVTKQKRKGTFSKSNSATVSTTDKRPGSLSLINVDARLIVPLMDRAGDSHEALTRPVHWPHGSHDTGNSNGSGGDDHRRAADDDGVISERSPLVSPGPAVGPPGAGANTPHT